LILCVVAPGQPRQYAIHESVPTSRNQLKLHLHS
jgi:hypothetical protein